MLAPLLQVEEDAVLRCFLLCRFAKTTLVQCSDSAASQTSVHMAGAGGERAGENVALSEGNAEHNALCDLHSLSLKV